MADKDDILPLAEGFAAPSEDAWRAMVDKVLKGADFDRALVSKTLDGLTIEPLYTGREPAAGADGAGFPGFAPYTRGFVAQGRKAEPGFWDIRQSHTHADPAAANKAIIADLEGGVTSIQLVLDTGETPSGAGVSVRGLDELDAALNGVLLDLAPIALRSVRPEGQIGAAALLLALYARRGHAPGTVRGALNIDPLGALAAHGRLPGDLEASLTGAAKLSVLTAKTWPGLTSLSVDTRPYHNAGASEAQDLGIALAVGTAYLRTLTGAGLSTAEAAGQIAFTLTADADLMLSIAKLRAFRRVWAQVLEACGAGSAAAGTPLHVETSARMMSVRDPWVNMLRVTVAGFAAAVGGADAVTIAPFTAALADATGTAPDSFARRIARNTQVVLMEEASLARVIDPAGGAFAFEQLTDDLARHGWGLFQDIERAGGMGAALTSGFIRDRIAETRAERGQAIATRKLGLTGVSEFPNLAEETPPTDGTDLAALARRPVPRSDHAVVMGSADGLADAAASGAYAEDLSSGLLGMPTAPASAPALGQERLAAAYEALRDGADAHQEQSGTRPAVFLATLGRLADFTARANFAKNLYAAGGLTAHEPGPLDGPQAAAEAFAEAPAPIAVLCSSDALYPEHAGAVAAALKAAGARHVVLAGKAKIFDAGLPETIDDCIFAGCDALRAVTTAHDLLGLRQAP